MRITSFLSWCAHHQYNILQNKAQPESASCRNLFCPQLAARTVLCPSSAPPLTLTTPLPVPGDTSTSWIGAAHPISESQRPKGTSSVFIPGMACSFSGFLLRWYRPSGGPIRPRPKAYKQPQQPRLTWVCLGSDEITALPKASLYGAADRNAEEKSVSQV